MSIIICAFYRSEYNMLARFKVGQKSGPVGFYVILVLGPVATLNNTSCVSRLWAHILLSYYIRLGRCLRPLSPEHFFPSSGASYVFKRCMLVRSFNFYFTLEPLGIYLFICDTQLLTQLDSSGSARRRLVEVNKTDADASLLNNVRLCIEYSLHLL